MNIALISAKDHILSHRVRGAGIYAQNLKDSLKKYFPSENIIESDPDNIPHKTDIVHFLYFEPFFLTLPFFNSKKTLVTVHDLIPFVFPKYFPSGIRGKIKWQIQRLLLKRCDAVITDSENSKRDIVKFVGLKGDKVRVVYLAADSDFKRISDLNKLENVRSKYGLPNDFVLYVGDATWNKNLPRLIDAVREAEIPLVLVGKALASDSFDRSNPWNRDLAVVQEKIKNNKNVKVLGFVEKDDLVALYNLAKVFVMPSLYEGFGLPILEAMSCGCPVVTSKGGSIPEIAKDSVYYVDPQSVEDIKEGVLKVVSNETLRNGLIRQGGKRAEFFSWEKTAGETIGVYKSLC